MENQTENTIDPEDDLKASNEVLKLKLELEHKMMMSDVAGLSPEIENQWLNSIYNFENKFKDAKQVKVYEFLGRPSFKKIDELKSEEIAGELDRVVSLMEQKGIALDCCVKYDKAVIYRFIIDELFEHEIDDISIEGYEHHFIYEEFHPNHDYDLRRYTTRFIESILSRKWSEEYDHYMLADTINFQGNEHTPPGISAIVLAFQEAHSLLDVEKIQVEKVIEDVVNKKGSVNAYLAYTARPFQEKSRSFAGMCTIHFVYEFGDWSVSGFEFPGFGD